MEPFRFANPSFVRFSDGALSTQHGADTEPIGFSTVSAGSKKAGGEREGHRFGEALSQERAIWAPGQRCRFFSRREIRRLALPGL